MLEHGPPPLDRRVGCTGQGAPGCPGRACGRKGDWEGVSLRAKQPRRGGSQLWRFGRREGEVKGLVEALVQEELDRNSAEWEIELLEPTT